MNLLRSRRFLCIVAIAICVRTAALAIPFAFANDPDDYLRFARNLALHGVYGPNPDQPSAYRPPGYPLLLAGLIRATGESDIKGIWPYIFGLHLLATVAIIAATMRIAERLIHANAGVIAGLFVAFDPLLVRQSIDIMSETVFTACLLQLLSSLICSSNRPTRRSILSVAISLTLAALIRPTVIPVWLAIGFVAIFSGKLRFWLGCSVVATILYAPWPSRNHQWSGHWILTTTHGGYTLWLGQNPEFYEREVVAHRPWPEESFVAWTMQNDKATIHLSEVERDGAFRDMALSWMKSHPREALRTQLYHLTSFWSFVYRSAEAPEISNWLRFTITATFSIWSIAAGACGLCSRTFWYWPGNLLLATIFAISAVHAVYWSNMRMRAPIEPIVAVLAAKDVASILTRQKRGQTRLTS